MGLERNAGALLVQTNGADAGAAKLERNEGALTHTGDGASTGATGDDMGAAGTGDKYRSGEYLGAESLIGAGATSFLPAHHGKGGIVVPP